MTVKCPHCGTEYDAEQKEMYRYTKCGVCGNGFVVGAATSLQKEEQGKMPHAEVQKRPKIGLRRPQADGSLQEAILEDELRMAINPQSAQPQAMKPINGITAAEERIRMYENMRQKKARTKVLQNFVESVMLLMLLVVVVGLCLWWMSHKNKVAAETARITAERESEGLRLAAERDRQMRERREKDRLEREAELVMERQQKQKEREEMEEQMQKEREARERVERELRDNKEHYHLYAMAIKENQFDLFVSSVTNGMDKMGGELCYLLPSATTPAPLYHVAYGTNGSHQVFRFDKDGKKDEIGFDVFQKQIGNVEYLVAKEGKVHFMTKRKSPTTGRLPMADESDPAETFFGALAPALKELKPTYDELSFDIFFSPAGSAKKIFVENLPFGCVWSRRNVREAIEKNTPFRHGSSYGMGSSRVKKYKRTVKIYNGVAIKQGVDGITYVPMTPPPERYYYGHYTRTVPNCIYRSRPRYYVVDNTRERWAALHAKALQEDADEAAFYERQRLEKEDRRNSARTVDEQRWQAKVEDILHNGTLFYKIRKVKVEADKDK